MCSFRIRSLLSLNNSLSGLKTANCEDCPAAVSPDALWSLETSLGCMQHALYSAYRSPGWWMETPP